MGGPNKSSQNYKNNSNRPSQSKSFNSQGTKEGKTQSGSSGQGNKDPSSTRLKSGDDFKSLVICHFCKLPGHFKLNSFFSVCCHFYITDYFFRYKS